MSGRKEKNMSRAKQRENRKRKAYEIKMGLRPATGEEKLDLHDYCGIKDPTPYLAVKNIIDQEKAEAVAKAWAAVSARERAASKEAAARRPARPAATVRTPTTARMTATALA